MAERLYLAQHQLEWEGSPVEVYNPNNQPIEFLPVIMGFNNGGSPGWYSAVSIAEDGVALGGHLCSHEGYMPHDLGILKGSRPDRHTTDYQKHYPGGYRMEFVPYEAIKSHAKLQEAFRLNALLPKTLEAP